MADVVKADSAAAIAALREMGCDVVLLTGDNQRTADAIARQVGGSRVIAQVLPQDKARVVQAKMQIENLSTAVKKFYLDNGFYPSTEQGLEALVTRPAIGKTPKNYPANGYITKIPKDPWGNDYVYTAPGQKVPFEIMSLGSDGAEGGEGEAADIWGEDVPDR